MIPAIISPNGDVLVPLDPANPTGDQALVYASAMPVDRGGTVPMPAESGVSDTWRIVVFTRAILARNGVPVLVDGKELEIPTPEGYETRQANVAHLLHDAEVRQAVPLLLSVATRMLAGELVAIDPTPPRTVLPDTTQTTVEDAPQ